MRALCLICMWAVTVIQNNFLFVKQEMSYMLCLTSTISYLSCNHAHVVWSEVSYYRCATFARSNFIIDGYFIL